MNLATIHIKDLNVRTIIGTHPWERTNKQDLVLNITLEYDAAKASKSDSIKDALDYERVATQAVKIIERSKDYLLEKLAGTILDNIMTDKRVERAVVRLDKPHAIAHARCVSFEVSARRPSKF